MNDRRQHFGDWTEDEILAMVRAGDTLRVKQYGPMHGPLRQRALRMVRAGQLRFVVADKGVIYFRAPL